MNINEKSNKSVANSARNRNKSVTNSPQSRNKSAEKMLKTNKVGANPQRIRNESATNPRQIRYAFVPLLQRFRNEHTNKNKESQARTWIPVECSLLIRYEFASLSPQTRYAFVAILLYCGMRGIEEIPLDAKFMASALIIDERTLRKSLDELLENSLLLEREKEREKRENKKEDTDRQTENGVVCVDSENFSQNNSDKNNQSNENKNGLVKKDSEINNLNEKTKHSIYSIEECLKYVEICQSKGDKIDNPRALANHLFKTGESDAFILATLYPAKQEELDRETYGEPRQFTDEPCRVCLGAKMADSDGKGYRKCEHCRDEKGKATGFEPKGENENE